MNDYMKEQIQAIKDYANKLEKTFDEVANEWIQKNAKSFRENYKKQ